MDWASICKVLAVNVCQGTGYPHESFHGSPQLFQANSVTLCSIRLWMFTPSFQIAIHDHPVILCWTPHPVNVLCIYAVNLDGFYVGVVDVNIICDSSPLCLFCLFIFLYQLLMFLSNVFTFICWILLVWFIWYFIGFLLMLWTFSYFVLCRLHVKLAHISVCSFLLVLLLTHFLLAWHGFDQAVW
jgi:hypothetical protein